MGSHSLKDWERGELYHVTEALGPQRQGVLNVALCRFGLPLSYCEAGRIFSCVGCRPHHSEFGRRDFFCDDLTHRIAVRSRRHSGRHAVQSCSTDDTLQVAQDDSPKHNEVHAHLEVRAASCRCASWSSTLRLSSLQQFGDFPSTIACVIGCVAAVVAQVSGNMCGVSRTYVCAQRLGLG